MSGLKGCTHSSPHHFSWDGSSLLSPDPLCFANFFGVILRKCLYLVFQVGRLLSFWRFLPFPGLDFLPQLNSVFPLRKNAGASSTLVLHSSPLNVLMGSSGKDDSESHELSAECERAHLGRREPKDPLKQVSTWRSARLKGRHSRGDRQCVCLSCYCLTLAR